MYELALLTNLLCFAGVAAYFVRQPACSVFHPLSFYLAFHGLVFVVRPIIGHLLGFQLIYQVYQFSPSPSDKLTALAGANAGMLAFAYFALRSGKAPMRFAAVAWSAAERTVLIRSALWMLALVLPLGLYSLVTRWGRVSDGVSDMVMDAGTGTFLNTATNGYMTDAQLMLATACAIIGWLFRFRIAALLPLAGFIALRAGTGGRGPFVTAAICLGLAWLYERRMRFPGPRAVAGILALAVLFNQVGLDRGQGIRAWINGAQAAEAATPDDGLRFMEGMDLGNLEYFEFLVYAIPQRTGTYEYLADHLMLLTEPVPRQLWPDKPAGSPVKLFELFDYGFPIGMTRSLPGEGWAALGWAGILLWCGLWGHVLGRIYQRFAGAAPTPFSLVGYMMLMGMLVVVYRDGTVITLVRSGLFYGAPIVLWWIFAQFHAAPRAVRHVEQAALPAAVLRRRMRLREWRENRA